MKKVTIKYFHHLFREFTTLRLRGFLISAYCWGRSKDAYFASCEIELREKDDKRLKTFIYYPDRNTN